MDDGKTCVNFYDDLFAIFICLRRLSTDSPYHEKKIIVCFKTVNFIFFSKTNEDDECVRLRTELTYFAALPRRLAFIKIFFHEIKPGLWQHEIIFKISFELLN